MAEETTNSATESKPEAEAKGQDTAPVTIPKERLDQEIAKRRESEAQLAALQKEYETLKTAGNPPGKPTSAPQPADLTAIQMKLASIEARDARRELAAQLGLNEKQSEKVQDLVGKGLSPEAALAAARVSSADLFSSQQNRGFDPSQHASVRSGGNGTPQANKLKDQFTAVAKLPSAERVDAAAEFLGKNAAKALGWTRHDL